MILVQAALIGLLLAFPTSVFGGPAEEANAVVDRWAAVFSANDADAVVKLYASDAILLGTVSPVIAGDTDAIRAYFSRLPSSGNKVVIGDRRTIVISDAAVVSAGFYDFTIMREGKPVPGPARFTMVLVKRDGQWLIAHHHSSVRPAPPK
jgi:uncharacterized protein (TIGR02246 family)